MLTLSPSQISVYRDECKRKWGFRSIAKIPTPTHPAAALGIEIDDTQLQPYLRDGRAFDYTRPSGSGDIAASALAFLPQPKSHGLEVQKHFTFRSMLRREELSYQGYVDLWMPSGGMPDVWHGETMGPAIPAVCDFKTTGNLKWQKTPKVLETDVQAMVYATFAMVATPARIVDLVWIYMQTKGTRKAKRTHLRVHAKHVFDQFKAIDAVGVEMMLTRRELEANLGNRTLEEAVLDLPPNPEACENFGGCPFRSRCNLSPAAFTTTAIDTPEFTDMSDTASLLAQLKAKRAGIKTGYELSNQQLNGQAAADAGVATVTVGINPPESLLPPPAPAAPLAVAAVEVAPVSNPPASALKEPVKRGPGRPKKGDFVKGSIDVACIEIPVDGVDAKAFTTAEMLDDVAQRHQRIGALVIELAALLGVA